VRISLFIVQRMLHVVSTSVAIGPVKDGDFCNL